MKATGFARKGDQREAVAIQTAKGGLGEIACALRIAHIAAAKDLGANRVGPLCKPAGAPHARDVAMDHRQFVPRMEAGGKPQHKPEEPSATQCVPTNMYAPQGGFVQARGISATREDIPAISPGKPKASRGRPPKFSGLSITHRTDASPWLLTVGQRPPGVHRYRGASWVCSVRLPAGSEILLPGD